MTLKEKIDQDLILSMKAKEETKLSVLRMLKSAIRNSEIAKQKDLEDTDILGLVQSQIKSRRDSVELYKKGDRQDLAQAEEVEIEILNEYLPEQIGEAEIREIALKAIQETGATSVQDMGRVMGKIMPETKGKADSSLVSKIVKEELSK
jgi:uncharacterized protein YqeY